MNTSNKFLKPFVAVFFSLLVTFAFTACESGPAEDAGEKINEVAEDTGNAIEDACEDVKEGVDAKDTDC